MRDSEQSPNMERLRWRCRRGMLELDLLLEAFLNNGYEALSEEDRSLFSNLLEQPDPQLLEWLLGKEKPEKESTGRLVETIRESV